MSGMSGPPVSCVVAAKEGLCPAGPPSGAPQLCSFLGSSHARRPARVSLLLLPVNTCDRSQRRALAPPSVLRAGPPGSPALTF